ncbi:MAG: helix-turn-helix transcriptional regulator [Bryobacteraceae bacterium]
MTTRGDVVSLTQVAVESRPAEGLLLKAPAASVLCSVSLRTWRAWDAAGRIPLPVRVGRSTFWRADELRAWVAAGCPDRETWHAAEK